MSPVSWLNACHFIFEPTKVIITAKVQLLSMAVTHLDHPCTAAQKFGWQFIGLPPAFFTFLPGK